MGTLLGIHEITENKASKAPWYFDDAYYSSNDCYNFKWPSTHFPCMISIHEDIMVDHGVRPRVRRWIEQQSSDTVIYDIIDKSYRMYFTKDRDHFYHIKNSWYRLWFEDEESALAFKLKFSDMVSPITETHPTRHYEPLV